MRLQPSDSGRAMGVFQLGKQKQIPLCTDWSQLSKGLVVPTGLLGPGMDSGVQSSSSPLLGCWRWGSLPQWNSSIFGTQGISLLSGWGTQAPLPKPLLRVTHPHRVLGTILP